MKHEAMPGTGSLRFCSCNQGFSGARVEERLAEHIANPNPNSLGAMLIKLQEQPVD